MVGLAQRPKALNLSIVVYIVMTAVALFCLGTERLAGRAATSVRLKPGEAAVSSSTGNISIKAEAHSHLDPYTAAAWRNLTDFRDRLLAIGIPFFGISQASKGRNNAPNLWKLLEPVVSCPPDQPLFRYGAGRDGGKQLCKLQDQEAGPCVIYSLGSHGALGDSVQHSSCAVSLMVGCCPTAG